MAHHQGYTAKTNAALQTLAKLDADAAAKPIDELLQGLDKLPAEVQGPLRNAGGGYVNHALFWTVMGPGCGGDPAGPVGDAIKARFGSLEKFREDFSTAAAKVFGSGWAWLYVDTTGAAPKLEICATPNQDTPAMEAGKIPILGLDVWEHAYCKSLQLNALRIASHYVHYGRAFAVKGFRFGRQLSRFP